MIFPDFSSNAKVWLYISSETLSDDNKKIIFDAFNSFSESWKSHGDQVIGKLSFMDDQVIVLGANIFEGSMCGRAVDAQVRFIKEMELETGFSFMNRYNICFKNNNEINVVPFSHLKSLVEKGSIDENTLIYNTMIQLNNDSIIVPIVHSPFGEMLFS